MTRATRTYLLLFLICVLVVCDTGKALLFVSNGQPPLRKDARGYWRLGGEIAQGDWLLREPPTGEWTSRQIRPPVYPLFLACCQWAFRDCALVVASAIQQSWFVVISVITAWICGRVTGSRFGILIGLALSVACIGRHVVGQHLFSDNLLCLTLVVYYGLLVAWYQRPSLGLAILIGAAIAVAMLVKPVAQLLWLPTLLAMGLRLLELHQLRRLLGHGVVMLLAMSVLVAPWLARNRVLYGRAFIAKSTGRALWWSCFHGSVDDHPLTAPLKFGDGPQMSHLMTELSGMDVQMGRESSVDRALRKRGYSQIEGDDLMLHASLEAIREQPREFALTRVGHFILFWIGHPQRYWWSRTTYSGSVSEKEAGAEGSSYEGQNTWCSPLFGSLHDRLMKWLWHPSRGLYACAALGVFIGWLAMMREPRLRCIAVAFGLLMAYFSVVTAMIGQCMYRYRIIIDPLMIVVFTAGTMSLMQMVRARLRRASKLCA